jgi:inhibitor of cysteine peptidase
LDSREGFVMRRSVFVAMALVIASALALVEGCAATETGTPTSGTLRVDANANGATVQLAPGAELVVALEANPTTGFDWKVTESLPPQLMAKDDVFESSATAGVVGAGGAHVFTYTAAAPGTGELDLEYVRSWEKGVPPERTFTLTVVVK